MPHTFSQCLSSQKSNLTKHNLISVQIVRVEKNNILCIHLYILLGQSIFHHNSGIGADGVKKKRSKVHEKFPILSFGLMGYLHIGQWKYFLRVMGEKFDSGLKVAGVGVKFI